jgi:hypothetical protein
MPLADKAKTIFTGNWSKDGFCLKEKLIIY